MYIYKITNLLNGKVYIGQTRRTVEQRYKEHIQCAIRGDGFYLACAMRNYGIDNFKVETIASTDNLERLNELEKFYIREYKSDSDKFGYNLSPGGDSNTMDSPIIKAKHDDKMRTEDVRKRIGNTVRRKIIESGRKDEYCKNLRNGFNNYLKSDKFKEDSKKRHLTPEHYRALNDAKNKSVYCINESGVTVAEFGRVTDAAKWWLENGYTVKNYDQLMDRIKQSAKENRYIKGLKWVYRV